MRGPHPGLRVHVRVSLHVCGPPNCSPPTVATYAIGLGPLSNVLVVRWLAYVSPREKYVLLRMYVLGVLSGGYEARDKLGA